MTTPFIFIGTHKVKPGMREAFKEHFAAFSADVVEPGEPRVHSFYGYASPGSDYVTIVQIHPDADSMATHMKVGAEHFVTAYADYLEPESTIQIYGELSDELIRTIAGAAQSDGDGASVTIREPFAGFHRLPPS